MTCSLQPVHGMTAQPVELSSAPNSFKLISELVYVKKSVTETEEHQYEFHPSIFYTGLIQLRAVGLKPIPAVTGREAVYTLDCSPDHHRANTETNKQAFKDMNLETPFNPTCMFLSRGMKVEYLVITHTSIWIVSSNYRTTVPMWPQSWTSILPGYHERDATAKPFLDPHHHWWTTQKMLQKPQEMDYGPVRECYIQEIILHASSHRSWLPDPTAKHRGGSVMVWVAMSLSWPCNITVLSDQMFPNDSAIFQDDNGPFHTTWRVEYWDLLKQLFLLKDAHVNIKS